MKERHDRTQRKGELILAELRSLVSQLPPGSCLPSENAMAVRFKAARMTATCAFRKLEEENLIERRRGNGSFVKGRRVVTFLLPSPGFLSLYGHNEGIARLELEGIRRAASEYGLEARSIIFSMVNQDGMLNVREIEQLDSSSLVIVSPWYAQCFRILSEHRCRVAWISTQSTFTGYRSYMEDWFKMEANRRKAIRGIIRLLYQAGCRRVALASPHINSRERRKNGVYQKREPEYDDLQLMTLKLPYTKECNSAESGIQLRKALLKAHLRYHFDGLILDSSLLFTGRNIHEFCGLPENIHIFGINIPPEQCRLDEPFPISYAPYEQMAHDAVELLLTSSRKGKCQKYDYLTQNTELLSTHRTEKQ